MDIDLQYPIGKFNPSGTLNESERSAMIQQIADTPSAVRDAVKDLSDKQLETPYRSGGWTVRQVVHHLADSHMNAYIRFRLAMTEDRPTIKPYEQQRWAELADAKRARVELSLNLLESLHARWVLYMDSLQPSDFSRKFIHPENGERDLDWIVQMYAWHGRHHTAHITSLRQRMGW
jgi:uncharacterized damage-inducible protein DinB